MTDLFETPRKKDGHYIEGRDYLPQAIAAFIAYWLLWPVGLVANIIWLREAQQVAADTGVEQPNVGCLKWMLYVQVGVAVLFALTFCGALILAVNNATPMSG